jgi:hypothetical protein
MAEFNELKKNLSKKTLDYKRKTQSRLPAAKGTNPSGRVDLHDALHPLRLDHAKDFLSKEGFELVYSRPTELVPTRERAGGESKEQKRDFVKSLSILKGVLFKRDMPYRTLLPLQGSFTTSGVGAVNLVQSVSNVTTTSEWASIDALFDEVFVHSMKFRFFPINDLGGGVGASLSSSTTGGIATVPDTTISNAPISMVSLFQGSNYSSASAMNANSTLAVHSSAHPFTYYWRNNTKFEPHGLSINATTGTNIGWLGWSSIAGISFNSGQIQFRMLNDSQVGNGSAAVIMGYYLTQYDVSFRSRS